MEHSSLWSTQAISVYKEKILSIAKSKMTTENTLNVVLGAINRVEANLPSLTSQEEIRKVVELYALKSLSDEAALKEKNGQQELKALLNDWINQLIQQTDLITALSEQLKLKDKVISELTNALELSKSKSEN